MAPRAINNINTKSTFYSGTQGINNTNSMAHYTVAQGQLTALVTQLECTFVWYQPLRDLQCPSLGLQCAVSSLYVKERCISTQTDEAS